MIPISVLQNGARIGSGITDDPGYRNPAGARELDPKHFERFLHQALSDSLTKGMAKRTAQKRKAFGFTAANLIEMLEGFAMNVMFSARSDSLIPLEAM